MRNVAAVVVVVTMLSGCVNYTASKVTAIVGGVGIAGGAVLLAKTGEPVAAAPISIGLFLGIGGIIGMMLHESPETREARQHEEEAQRQAQIDAERAAAKSRAWHITQEVAKQARDGNCALVGHSDRTVFVLDPEFHATVFLRDAAIKRCLDAGHPPAGTP